MTASLVSSKIRHVITGCPCHAPALPENEVILRVYPKLLETVT